MLKERRWIHIICSTKVRRKSKYSKQKTVLNVVNTDSVISIIIKYEWDIHALNGRD